VVAAGSTEVDKSSSNCAPTCCTVADSNHPSRPSQRGCQLIPALAASFGQALADVTFKACYCSILDECWISSLQDIRVVPVRACPAPAVAFVPNGK